MTDHIAELEKMIRTHRRLDYILVGFWGLNVFLAVNAMVSMAPGIFQTTAVLLNVAAAVYGWHVLRRSVNTREAMIDMLERARREWR